MNKAHGIVLASGTGARFNHHLPKQFVKVAGRTLFEHTIDVFESHESIADITLVIPPAYRSLVEELLLKNQFKKVCRVLNGGDSRQESSFIGINSISAPEDDFVLLHDAVRPFLSHAIINRCLEALETSDAVDVAVPSTDTIVEVDEESNICGIPDRRNLRSGQTPQCFRLGLIRDAHLKAQAENYSEVTDDCGLVFHYKMAPIKVVQGHVQNIKVTWMEDIYQADRLFQLRTAELPTDFSGNAYAGKTLVVFGGSRGIGKGVLDEAEALGARVHSFSRENGVDISDYDCVQDALSRVMESDGQIDFVVNTAGVLAMGKLEDRTTAEIINDININYIGAIHVVKAAIPCLRASKGSMLLFTSSSYSRGRSMYASYSSSKAAVVNFAQAVAEEIATDGIRINVINPERTATPMRTEAFGKEPEGTLLSVDQVAGVSLRALIAPFSGQVVDVRNA